MKDRRLPNCHRHCSATSILLKINRYREDRSHFLVIDPRNSYYLLNADGNCESLQTELEGLFKTEKIKGKAGLVPPPTDLKEALKNHDLFLYFGHGTGMVALSLT
ncbi:Separase [Raphanus sativus]|nr:Separase [Raphanus sativus]